MYLSLSLSLYFSLSLCFFGQVKSPHHSDKMSQRSQGSKVALWRCSLNVFVFVFVIVFVFVFVFVIVFFWSGQVSSSLWSNVSKVTRLWGRSLTVFLKCICLCHCLCLCICLCHCVFLVRSSLLITLIKCLKGHKALGSLCMSKSKTPCLSVCSEWQG